jgi:hypothetical protein
VAAGGNVPDGDPVLECRSFPVCSPALARDRAHPIRTPVDLVHHVRLDYETLRDGRRLSEWDFWFDAIKVPRPDVAGRDAVKAFVAWLWKELRGEDEFKFAPVGPSGPTRAPRARANRR